MNSDVDKVFNYLLSQGWYTSTSNVWSSFTLPSRSYNSPTYLRKRDHYCNESDCEFKDVPIIKKYIPLDIRETTPFEQVDLFIKEIEKITGTALYKKQGEIKEHRCLAKIKGVDGEIIAKSHEFYFSYRRTDYQEKNNFGMLYSIKMNFLKVGDTKELVNLFINSSGDFYF